ncbi:MAG TPA: polysaccharide biosynthesis C-terminal domain-containing protein, partial [Ktedonobacteraceae bacterium]|nr:polysaccharide biosynthesis C-terminal domain-containing protein [Ktedonobacteraceae bacterium]
MSVEGDKADALKRVATKEVMSVEGDKVDVLKRVATKELVGVEGDKSDELRKVGTEVVGPLRGLLKTSGLYALSSVTLPLISLVLAPFLTHSLSPFDYGVLTILNTSISLAAGVTQLGLGSAFFRAYSYDYSSDRDRRAIIGTVVMLLGLVSLPLVGLITLTAPWLAGLLLGSSSLGNAIALAAMILLLQNLTVPGFAWLRAENRAFFYSLLSISNLLITLLANLILVGALHFGLIGSLLATACGYGCVLVCTLPWLLWRAFFSIRTDIMHNLLSFGLPLVVSFLSTWVLQLSDRYLLSIFSSFAETAKYAVAYTLGSAMGVAVLGPFTLAWPAAVYAIAKREDAAHIFMLVFRWFGLFLLLSTFALSLLGIIVLNVLFPASYHSGANIIPIVASSLAFYGVAYVFGAGTILTRKTWWSIVFTIVAAAVNIALNLVLIPFFGAMGAAVSTLVAYVVYALIAYIVNQRIYPVPFETVMF